MLLGLASLASWSSGLVLVLVLVLVAYIAAFAVGLGPVFRVLIGEVFPVLCQNV